ncbi:MAG: hypothetical protein ACOX9C_02915 [Kiritimatiellia bacterium]
MNAAELKKAAHERGADLVGVAPAERWADWPGADNPRVIQPQCQSVIVIGRRMVRGAFRGVEEGTNFGSTYRMYGADWHENTFLVRVVHAIALALEATGAEAVPLLGGGTGLDCNALAHAAGLGSVGKGGFFLTPEYGHRQRFALVLTDAALDGDPVADLDFCNDCNACLDACPLSALRDAGGATFEIDTRLCAICENGRVHGGSLSYAKLDRFAASCGRACLVALEGKTGNAFHERFRKRSVWSRDVDGKATLHPVNATTGGSK